ncbi:sulfotransferase [Fretibacter rubidus]|uniref:sulfotransferase n=1 Tax=Fretibacter rubidus TaxID=570162 RepID=UPI003529EE12
MTDTDIQTALSAARKDMQSGGFGKALTRLAAILDDVPDHKDALYMAAVCARYQKDFGASRTYLERLKQTAPDYGRAFQEDGHLALALGEPSRALAAFALATRYNPALAASWSAQAKILREQGRVTDAVQAEAQVTRLSALPPELLAVTNHIHEGRILQAEAVARAFMIKHPRHIEGMRLLADIGTRLGVHDDAIFLLETAIELAPDNVQLRIDIIQVLRKRQRYTEALDHACRLYDKDPSSPMFQSLYAIEKMQSGDYEGALALFDKVLDVLPNDASTLTSRGHALKTYGQSEAAVRSYKLAVAADPLSGDAWSALANLKTYRFSDSELARLQAVQSDRNLPFMARVHIAFALGKAFEDAGDYAKSFENYALGNALKAKQSRYTTEQMHEQIAAQVKHVTGELIKNQGGQGSLAPDPIFILGLPRAGSTLIEQILASHSHVDGTMELPNILSTVHRLRGRNQITDRERYPRILGEMSGDELRVLGEDYIKATQIHRQGAAYFTDKMPNNFWHIGLIHLILPNAKIIDVRRRPMDCCWSGFKQLFAEGQEFTYGLDRIGHYYRAYVDMMDHWDAVLPEGTVLRVQHEDVLDDLPGQVSRVLDYCGLPFEQSCVDFHKTDRAVRTASSEQVRRPISKKGVGQWKNFTPYLDPLRQALGPLNH